MSKVELILITHGKVIRIDLQQHVAPSESPGEIHWVIFRFRAFVSRFI